MNTELNDLVIGRKYKVKSKEHFDKLLNKDSGEYSREDYDMKRASGHAGEEMYLHEIVNRNELVLYVGKKYSEGYLWVRPEHVDEILGQVEPSKKVMEAVRKLREEKYVRGYDGGPGGGDTECIDTSVQGTVLPMVDGENDIYLKVTTCKRTWSVDNINELFEKGQTQTSFEATKYTTIRTELKLIEDKTQLPKRSSWSTMRD
jgi:hypothetical protein